MLLVEFVLILIVAGFGFAGAKAGFFPTLGRLVGAVLGFLIGRAWYAWLAGIILPLLSSHPTLIKFLAFLLIFCIVDGLVNLVFSLIGGVFSLASWIPFAKTISRLLGGVLGLVEGVVILGALIFVVLRFRPSLMLVGWISGSSVAGYTERVFEMVLRFLL